MVRFLVPAKADYSTELFSSAGEQHEVIKEGKYVPIHNTHQYL